MTLLYRYRKWRSRWRRRKRLLFVSPAEIAFIRILGGHVWNVPYIHTLNDCQLVMWYSLGKLLKRWEIKRELRITSGIFSDFGSSEWFKVIEVDSKHWHFDVLAEAERDQLIRNEGYDILHIRTEELRNSLRVRAKVNKFLSR